MYFSKIRKSTNSTPAKPLPTGNPSPYADVIPARKVAWVGHLDWLIHWAVSGNPNRAAAAFHLLRLLFIIVRCGCKIECSVWLVRNSHRRNVLPATSTGVPNTEVEPLPPLERIKDCRNESRRHRFRLLQENGGIFPVSRTRTRSPPGRHPLRRSP